MLAQLLSRVRRNHGLEHATIHILSEKYPNRFNAQGNATHQGFFLNIYGNIGIQEIESAAYEAVRRMKRGEHHLAVHPNCGTVLLTTAAMATIASQAAFGLELRRRSEERMTAAGMANGLPGAILAAAIALIASRPLGMQIQEKITTDGRLGDLEIAGIQQIRPTLVTRIFQLLLGQQRNRQVQSFRIDTVG